jgi:hypothetical protein
MKKKNEIIIVLFSLFLVLFLSFKGVFGSSMDFLTQHIVFPNYLRELFYSTGKIIPSFMVNIGSGQNIFNIAYYGLLNPIILISYFFPFFKMLDYIVISNIILFILSNLLFYRFIDSKFSKYSLFLTFLFMFSGPLLFQFHRHFMFVNYMPFLILSLINIDKKRNIRLIFDLFLIIMTSFYYSIPCILVILIYYIYSNFDNFCFKKFFHFLILICISILMSSVLLVPTFYSILSSRSGVDVFNYSLFIPNINLDLILYGGYSVGLTSICFISFIYLLLSKKKDLFLFLCISFICFIPFFAFILNGGLYIRGKVFIPFLPLFIYIIGIFINDLFDDKVDLKKFIYLIFIVNFIVLFRYHVLIYYVDLFFTLILLFLYVKFRKEYIIIFPMFLLSFIICLCYNYGESYFSRDYYNVLNSDYHIDTSYRVSNLSYDSVNIDSNNYISSIYSSTVNRYYSNLYYNVFHNNNGGINNMSLNGTSNVLFNKYMGVKYVYSDHDLGYPYLKVSDGLYELDVNSIGYVNSRCVNKEYFDSLSYPYNLDILLNYVPLSSCDFKPISSIREINLSYSYSLGNYSSINDGLLYVSHDDVINVHVNDDLTGKLLFIDILGQSEQDNDISLSINGQDNLLTHKGWLYPNNNNDFHYLIGGESDFVINVSKGIYNISDIRFYILDYGLISDLSDSFNIDVMNSEIISGSIDVSNDGYFMLSIPYDQGFNILVDGHDTRYYEINDLIGFPLESGNHSIVIRYYPRGLLVGKTLSAIGFCLYGVFVFLEIRRKYEG